MCSVAAARAQQELLQSIFIIALSPVPFPGAVCREGGKTQIFSFGLLPEVEAAAPGHPAHLGPGTEPHSWWPFWLCQVGAGCGGKRP